MATYYCVKRHVECDGKCDICPVDPNQRLFAFDTQYPDPVNKPSHYTLGKIEVFDFIKAWELSFAEGNVVKYVVRAPHKKNQLEDLKKARWYLDQLIKEAEQNADR